MIFFRGSIPYIYIGGDLLTDVKFLAKCLVVKECHHTFDPVKQSETPQRRAPRRGKPTRQIAKGSGAAPSKS